MMVCLANQKRKTSSQKNIATLKSTIILCQVLLWRRCVVQWQITALPTSCRLTSTAFWFTCIIIHFCILYTNFSDFACVGIAVLFRTVPVKSTLGFERNVFKITFFPTLTLGKNAVKLVCSELVHVEIYEMRRPRNQRRWNISDLDLNIQINNIEMYPNKMYSSVLFILRKFGWHWFIRKYLKEVKLIAANGASAFLGSLF